MDATVTTQAITLGSLLSRHKDTLLTEWLRGMSGGVRSSDRIDSVQLQEQCSAFVELFIQAAEISVNYHSVAYDPLRAMLEDLSRTRARQGFSSSETAAFVFSLKRPVFTIVRQELAGDSSMAKEMWAATELLDGLGLYATENFSKWREDTIRRQQEELLELSTPVVRLWTGILMLPLIGTLDSTRTQVVMESLLEAIVKANAHTAIIDITGVPTVDTVVAQHLLKTVAAARLMGADCIISGIRPQIAQTIVHLGINLLDLTTKSSLADAFALALQRSGFKAHRDATPVHPSRT